MSIPKEVREYFGRLGRRTSRHKAEACRRNLLRAHYDQSAPLWRMEQGYKAFKSGQITASHAARKIARTSFLRFRRYVSRRDGGETLDQIAMNPPTGVRPSL